MTDDKLQTLNEEALAVKTIESDELGVLLKKSFKPKTEETSNAINKAVHSLAERALSETVLISQNSITTIEAFIASIDKKMTEQINHILHHEDFRILEGSWRGVERLVQNSETGEKLKVRVLDASKKELGKMFKKYKGTAWDQSPLFKKLYEEEYGSAGGEPYGCMIGDYEFCHRAPDIAWLEGMSKVSAAGHIPFISAVSPELFNMESWDEVSNPRDISKILSTAEYASWNSLRENEDSKYIGLTMPRTLARLPYNNKDNPVEEFDFEENVTGKAKGRFVWSNAAYAMGLNVNRAFLEYGWCTAIRGVENGGVVEGLPAYSFQTDDGGIDMTCPTEVAITDRREAELSKAGLLPLTHWKNTDYAVFIGGQSLYAPGEYDNPEATANANLSARLPYMFAICRFAHYLKCIVRDKIGSFSNVSDIQNYLSQWISQYVVDPTGISNRVKACYPLSEAQVEVIEDESNPGYYKSIFHLKPHFQLEGLTVSLRLVSKLPAAGGGE